MTKAILLPINIVAINHAGLSVKKDKIRALISPLLLSNSILSLLEEIKAISIPEKKAENNRQRSMMIIEESKMVIDFPSVAVQNASDIFF